MASGVRAKMSTLAANETAAVVLRPDGLPLSPLTVTVAQLLACRRKVTIVTAVVPFEIRPTIVLERTVPSVELIASTVPNVEVVSCSTVLTIQQRASTKLRSPRVTLLSAVSFPAVGQ